MSRMRWRTAVVIAFSLMAGAATTTACDRQRPATDPLREVFTPRFERVPPREPSAQSMHTLGGEWRGAPGDALRADFLSWQAVGAALALGLILGIGIDYRGWRRAANIDLLLMFAAGLALFDSMRFFAHLRNAAYLALLDWVFIAVVLSSVALVLRAVYRVVRPGSQVWTPRGSTRTLAALAIALLASNLVLAFIRPPDDAGFFANLGAQRLRERGRLPYGDPLLTGTPGAAYGPLLYLAHVPFQIAVAPEGVNRQSPALPQLTNDVSNREQSTYRAPPEIATQLCTVFFHVAGVVALFVAVRRLARSRTAWAAVCLYCGSLAVLGIGGAEYSVAGITFVSHIAPAAVTLMAFAALPWPVVAGVLLVAAAGVGFYPAFMAPAWLGYYWNDRQARMQFAVACAVSAVILCGFVFALSRPSEGRSRVGTVLHDTFTHHTDPHGYGSSPFGFWGQRPGVRQWMMTPLGGSGFTAPAWLLLSGFIGVTFFLARGRGPAELALLSAALAIAATLIKPHATGTYMAWYYGLMLVGLSGRAFTCKPKLV